MERKIVPVASGLLGAVFAIQSIRKYTFWNASKGPGPGFLPLIVGLLLIAFSVVAFLQEKDKDSAPQEKDTYLFIVGILATVAAVYVVGFLPALFIFCILWMKVKEKLSWKTTIIVCIILAAIVYVLFIFWLKVPFRFGILESVLKR